MLICNLKDQLVEREIGNRLPEPRVLGLQIFHPPDLIGLEATYPRRQRQ
jgi:hypothetical protein